MTRAAVAAAALLALALPAHAAAQVPPPAPTPAPPAPTPTPVPPATGTLATSAQDTLSGVALRGRAFTVRMSVKPYVANEKFVVRVYRGKHKKILVKSLAPKPVAGGAAAVATLKVKSAKPGTLTIKASHKATPALTTLHAKTLRVKVMTPAAGPGARGPLVRILQGKLAALHYAVPRSGVYDGGTGEAVMAFRKLTGMSRTYIASEQVFTALLKGKGAFHVRHPGDGHHVEARLNQQVLALIDGKNVVAIYHTSSGKPSTPTVQGKFAVYSKTPGTNAKGMVDSNYFIRGYAIHGYYTVPPYNASHGCLRVPIRDAATIYNWLRVGDVVWVEP